MNGDSGAETGTTVEQMSDNELCKWLTEKRGIYTSPVIMYHSAPSLLKEQTDTFNDMVRRVSERVSSFEKPYQRRQFMDSVKNALMSGNHLAAFNDSQYLDFIEQVFYSSHTLRDEKERK